MKRQLQKLKEKCIRLEHEKQMFKTEINKLEASMNKIFTPGQILKFKSLKSLAKWTLKEISSAVSLYATGPRSYRLLRKRD